MSLCMRGCGLLVTFVCFTLVRLFLVGEISVMMILCVLATIKERMKTQTKYTRNKGEGEIQAERETEREKRRKEFYSLDIWPQPLSGFD